MGKYVYLFELDSVRMSDEEIIIGQKALYDEIVVNGNTVVLTYNQLVESRAFFSLFENREYYDSILALFESGKIKISQFGELRTVSHYVMNTLNGEEPFIYSGLPLKKCQKRLTALVKRSLMFSDLSEIYSYTSNGHRKEDELFDLFVEMRSDTEEECKEKYKELNLDEITEHMTKLSIDEMREIIDKLYWLLSVILRLSPIHNIYISPKPCNEYINLKLHNIIQKILTLKKEDDNLWNEAITVIKNLDAYNSLNYNRSTYLKELHKISAKCSDCKIKYCYAEAIINLCYNYTCEISICNISKHYNINELISENGTTFQTDFWNRLHLYWNGGENAENKYLRKETNSFLSFNRLTEISDFKKAVRKIGYLKDNTITYNDKIPAYEYFLKEQQRAHKKSLLTSIGKDIALSVFCVVIACLFEITVGFFQSVVDNRINFDSYTFMMFETIIFLFATEAITTFLATKVPWLISLSDAIGGIGILIVDGFSILIAKSQNYSNKNYAPTDLVENSSKGLPIDYVKSNSLNRYLRFRKSHKKSEIFKDLNCYHFLDTESDEAVKGLLKLEELYDYKFGLIYRSEYNTFFVDPVIDGNGKIIAYERIIPTNEKGVVIVPIFKDKVILLDQTRHAIRGSQLCLPRGFGETNLTPKENAIKEIVEELGVPKDSKLSPIYLGTVYSDSGLTAGQADVFLIEIDEYDQSNKTEGINAIKEYTIDELKHLIASKEINDGFTLSAYALYHSLGLHQRLNEV